jgi:segregation and condensation protein A
MLALAPSGVAPLPPRPAADPSRSAPPVRIGAYDGPLDLLLLLVRREGVDLRAIPVARICDAYLAALDEGDIDVDAAGEYLVLAATLCQLKARELLPRVPGAQAEEEEEDPGERLARRLVEYERFRLAAEELGRKERLDRDVFVRPGDPEGPAERPIDPGVEPLGLLRLFYGLVERRAAPPPTHDVRRETLSFVASVRWVLGRLDDGADHSLAELFVDVAGRSARVYTFLAVLEMARLCMLDLVQHLHLGAVRLTGRVRAADADLSHLPEDV